jgi:hypothetical protein
VYERQVTLTAGVETTFETRDLSSGADPVLHLITPAGVDFARNDDADSGTRAARLTVKPIVSGTYVLVVHAYAPASSGTARIYRDGTSLGTVPVGGWRAMVAGIRQGETLEVVRRPGEPLTRAVMYIFDPDQQRIWQRVTGGGTAGGLRFNFQFLAGTRHVLVGGRGGDAAPMRLVRNDSGISGHDPDGDHLGTELESDLGTCSTLSGSADGFNCALASDARDTDGDGIRDEWEVLGRSDFTPQQPLPLWGADPRHKDIFVEVDYMRLCGEPANADRKMEPEVAHQWAAFYADQVGPPVSAERRAARAADLENPDGRPGIRLHLDTGQAGPPSETTYGDWGGHSVVAPVTSGGACMKGQSPDQAWPSMTRVRRGVFHYVLVYFGGGGQSTEWRAWASFNGGSALNSAHEFGHSLGLGHSGRAQAYFQDPNCKPNYPSIMNYGYYDHWSETSDVGFSDGRDRPTWTNGALTEQHAINPADSWFANHLRTIFHYNVDGTTGNVDWNRNGMFESLTVRAYTNYAPGDAGCEWTKYNAVPVPGVTMRSPALIRLGGYAYVLYARASDGLLAYSRTPSSLICRDAIKGPCGGASFGAEKTRTIDASRGMAAVRLQYGPTQRLLIVAAGNNGKLRETQLTVTSNGTEYWTAAATRVPSGVASEPSLRRISDTEAYLAFAGSDRRVRIARYTTTAGWSPVGEAEAPPAFPTGPPPLLPTLPTGASPALGWAYTPSQPHSRALYGAFARADGTLTLYRLNRTTGYWTEIDDLDTHPSYQGRPAVAWAPTYTTNQTIGHLYLHYLTPGGVIHWMSTYTAGIGAAAVQRIGLDGPLVNKWANPVRSLESMQETEVGSNLRVVYAGPSGNLVLLPNADGISDFNLTNNNDWRVFRTSLCRTLMYPKDALQNTVDSEVDNPIHCEPAPPHT